MVGEAGEGGQEPAVAELPLVDVVPGGSVNIEVGPLTQLPGPPPDQATATTAVVERTLLGREPRVSE